MARASSVPTYLLHRPSGQARVRIRGRDIYLGKHGSPESIEAYRRLLAECAVSPAPKSAPTLPPAFGAITVRELLARYWLHAEAYYRKRGKPTSEHHALRTAFRPLRALYASLPVSEFGPVALKAVRQHMIDQGRIARPKVSKRSMEERPAASDATHSASTSLSSELGPDGRPRGLSRSTINRSIDRIKRTFKWGVENEIVPPSVYQGLAAVAGLRMGRSPALETEPVRPVSEADINSVLPHVSAQVSTMIQIQALTGMRPGEVVILRSSDIDVSGDVWIYRPESHKNEHRGQSREVAFGPKAQILVRPWLRGNTAAYLFSPADAEAKRNAGRSSKRQSPVQPSQRNRRKKSRKVELRDRYDVDSYRRAINRGCDRAGIPRWSPHQLRHTAATRIRKAHGLEAARTVLGQRSLEAAGIYAEMDQARSLRIMAEMG